MSSTSPTPSPSSILSPSPEAILQASEGVLKSNFINRWWRIQNLYKIRDKNQNLINLRFNTIQLQIIRDIRTFLDACLPITYWSLKYRQGGVSTFWLIFYLDDTIFSSNTISGILADKKENLGYLFEIVRLAHANMPPGVRPRLDEDSKTALSFPSNNSKIFVSLSIKSTALHNLHVSEACYCDGIEIQRTLGACTPKANRTFESTGNGLGNYGYDSYYDAKMGLTEYKARFSPWFIQKEYAVDLKGADPLKVMGKLKPEEKRLEALMKTEYGLVLRPEQVLWRRMKEKEQRDLFPQEFPETELDAFLASGSMFFDVKKIQTLYDEARAWENKAGPAEVDPGGDWVMFHKPEKYSVYAAGADPSEGANDYCVLKIVDVVKQREVFVYRARCGIKKFYQVCDEYGRLYNNALLGVERNNHGHAVLLGLEEDCRYPNLFYTETKKNRAVGKDIPEKKAGWNTTGGKTGTRTIMLDQLKFAIEGEPDEDAEHFRPLYTIYDKIFLSEALTFKEIDGKFQAVTGKFDDTIFAGALMAQMMFSVLRRRNVRSPTGIQVGGERASTPDGEL